MNAPFWRSLPAKLRLYEALYSLNRGFEAALLSLERLEHLGIFRLENRQWCSLTFSSFRLPKGPRFANESLDADTP